MTVDLLERGPRLRRFITALIVAIAVAIAAYVVCDAVIAADTPGDWRFGASRATGFFTGLAGAVAYTVTYVLLRRRDRRRDFPAAKLSE